MKFNYKRMHIGRRTLKTAAAVIISMLIVSFYGATTSKMLFAMLGAMSAMEPSFKKSVEACLTQIVGMILGAIAGVLLLCLPINPLICVGIGIVFVITVYNVLEVRFSPVLPCMIIVTLCTTPDILPLTYAVGRFWDTAIGLGVGMLINVLVLPYDNSLKIRNSIEYLKGEVITFLEGMFDGDKQYPDTEKLSKMITGMAGQLGILSEQWFPLRRKQNAKRLAILRECEGKSRQLLAQMEMLSRVNSLGRLTAENRERLNACGAKIQDARVIDEVSEADIITNYYVEQILTFRQELMEELMQFPIKRTIKNLTPIYENETKSIYTGELHEFGPVVLKIDQNIAQLKSEYQMLVKLNGNHSCKVYSFDGEKGELIEERILPGYKLRAEESLEKRLDAFVQVFEAIHVPVKKLAGDNIPTYLDWLEYICEYCKKNSVSEAWSNRALQACTIAFELFEKYPDRVLLHGDLHHDNLLQKKDGSYAFVDPKGVIGPEIFDLPRFILNELDTEYEESEAEHIEKVIRLFSERLNYPVEDVKKLFYMEVVLANVWSIEDGEDVNMEMMEIAERCYGGWRNIKRLDGERCE